MPFLRRADNRRGLRLRFPRFCFGVGLTYNVRLHCLWVACRILRKRRPHHSGTTHMISFRNFALRRGERLLLSKVDIALHAGWRVGVVGRNGCGKTSLFAAILGEVEADSGDLEKSPKLRIASVAQETPSLPDAAIDIVVSGDTEVHAVLQAEAAEIGRASGRE